MRDDHEEILAHNPVLLARCFWWLSQKFAEKSYGRAPELPLFIVGSAILFHSESVEKIQRMQFDGGLLKLVTERPDLLGGVQGRLEAALKPSLFALQLAVAANLITREGGYGFPTFRAMGTNIPVPLRDPHFHGEMVNASKRLGAWLAMDSMAIIQQRLNVEF